MALHTDERPFICDVCGQGFYMLSLLNKHKRKHFITAAQPSAPCGAAAVIEVENQASNPDPGLDISPHSEASL